MLWLNVRNWYTVMETVRRGGGSVRVYKTKREGWRGWEKEKRTATVPSITAPKTRSATTKTDMDKEASPSEKLVLEFIKDTALTEVSFTLWNHSSSLTDTRQRLHNVWYVLYAQSKTQLTEPISSLRIIRHNGGFIDIFLKWYSCKQRVLNTIFCYWVVFLICLITCLHQNIFQFQRMQLFWLLLGEVFTLICVWRSALKLCCSVGSLSNLICM